LLGVKRVAQYVMGLDGFWRKFALFVTAILTKALQIMKRNPTLLRAETVPAPFRLGR
jgi:hypothetical protein